MQTQLQKAEDSAEALERKLAEQNEILKTLNASYERFVPKEFQRFLRKESIVDIRLGDHISKEMTVNE